MTPRTAALVHPVPTRTPPRPAARPRRTETTAEPLLSIAGGDDLRVVSLAQARTFAFEEFAPVRGIASYEGQAHLTGLYCFRGHQVPYRSVLHRDVLRVLDYGGDIANICLFPFYVHPGPGAPGRAPDFLARLTDGRLRVIDVRRAARAHTRTSQDELAPTRAACRELRWEYRLITEPDRQLHVNLTWLSRYRRRPLDYDRYRDGLQQACGCGASIDELMADVDAVALALPVLFHMLWQRELRIALDMPIRADSLVTVRSEAASGRG